MSRLVRRGMPVVVSAPSGGGKTTISRKAIASLEDVEFSISHTTRAPRSHERDGVDYHFVDDREFDALVADGAFLEWATVHGNRYGTGHAEVEARLSVGTDVIFDIDVQGGRQIVDQKPDAVLVYILPPSLTVLADRLRNRGSDPEDVIERRLAVAREEIESAHFYTHWLVNDDLEEAVVALQAIIRGERFRRIDRKVLFDSVLNR